MLTQFNLAESAVVLDYEQLCGAVTQFPGSAIDDFYDVRDTTLKWAYASPFSGEPILRANLILLLFSAAESYFRRVIAEVLNICPVAAEAASNQQIPIGAINAIGLSNLGLVISDTKGLTSKDEIRNRTANLLGIAIKQNSSLDVAIGQFEKICTLRHCIVHSSGELLYTNRRELKVRTTGRLCVSLDNKSIQSVVQVVVNAVRAYNNHVANEVIQRWFVGGHLVGRWQDDKEKFKSVASAFSSKRDALPPQSPFRTYLKAKKLMIKKAQQPV